MNNNLTAVEQEKLNTIVRRVLAVGVEGLTKKERKSRKELLTKKYPGQNLIF